MKTFTVIDTRTNSKKVFESQATTLGELKVELHNLGISTEDMSIQEGLTKTELLNDESILPTQVNFRGTVTDNLVFRITRTNEKTASGAISRHEIYNLIETMNLAGKVLEKFSKNFTNVSNEDLLMLISEENAKDEKELIKPQKVETKMFHIEDEDALKNLYIVVTRLLNILWGHNCLDDDEYRVLDTMLKTNSSTTSDKSPYSSEDINDMFKGM